MLADAVDSERQHDWRLVTQMALGYPEVGFSLTSDGSGQAGRKLVECPPANGAGERFFQLFGERLDLIEVRKEAAGLQIHGYTTALGDQGPVRGAQNVFVNRRIVRDRTIAHAISTSSASKSSRPWSQHRCRFQAYCQVQLSAIVGRASRLVHGAISWRRALQSPAEPRTPQNLVEPRTW